MKKIDVSTGWSSPPVTSAVNLYWGFAKLVVKVILGGICGLVLFGCFYLANTIINP